MLKTSVITCPSSIAVGARKPGEAASGHLVVQLEGLVKDDGDTKKPRVALIPVIDVSGSMGGTKIHYVRQALERLSEYLQPDDYLGMVTFSTVVATPLAVDKASDKQLAKARRVISELHPGGGTNMYLGLQHALRNAEELARAARSRSIDLVRIIVLTDGRSNAGPVRESDYQSLLSDRSNNITVSTIGVGFDCDHDLLGSISTFGLGAYGFAETAEDAARGLGAEVGGALSGAATQVRVRVTGRAGYTILPALGTTVQRDGFVLLPIVKQGETKNLVFPVEFTVPKARQVRPVSYADVEIEYADGEEQTTNKLLPKVLFSNETSEVAEELQEIIDLAVLADAQRQAEEAARLNDWVGASNILRIASGRMSTATISGLSDTVAANYSNQVLYAQTSGARNSFAAATRTTGGLVTSSAAVDASMARAGVSYLTREQTAAAADASGS